MTHERVVLNPKIMFGKPTIKGTRITVEHILRKLAEGMTEEEILKDHTHLTRDDIRAAAAYGAAQVANEDILFASESNS